MAEYVTLPQGNYGYRNEFATKRSDCLSIPELRTQEIYAQNMSQLNYYVLTYPPLMLDMRVDAQHARRKLQKSVAPLPAE